VWLLLVAMLAFRFGQGMYFPFSTIHYHNVIGIPLSLVGVGLGSLAVASVAARRHLADSALSGGARRHFARSSESHQRSAKS
jgi:hypothetical protein